MASHWEEFYSTHLPPTDFEDNRKLLREFSERHNETGQRMVLITVSNTLSLKLFKKIIISVRRDHCTIRTQHCKICR